MVLEWDLSLCVVGENWREDVKWRMLVHASEWRSLFRGIFDSVLLLLLLPPQFSRAMERHDAFYFNSFDVKNQHTPTASWPLQWINDECAYIFDQKRFVTGLTFQPPAGGIPSRTSSRKIIKRTFRFRLKKLSCFKCAKESCVRARLIHLVSILSSSDATDWLSKRLESA